MSNRVRNKELGSIKTSEKEKKRELIRVEAVMNFVSM